MWERIDSLVHHALVDGLCRNGFAPNLLEIAKDVGATLETVERSLERLHENHGLVLHPGTRSPWIVQLFSLSPTAVAVVSEDNVWWAPCLWCATGILTLIGRDADIRCRLGGEAEDLTHIPQLRAASSKGASRWAPRPSASPPAIS
jgi:hypothetical protein